MHPTPICISIRWNLWIRTDAATMAGGCMPSLLACHFLRLPEAWPSERKHIRHKITDFGVFDGCHQHAQACSAQSSSNRSSKFSWRIGHMAPRMWQFHPFILFFLLHKQIKLRPPLPPRERTGGMLSSAPSTSSQSQPPALHELHTLLKSGGSSASFRSKRNAS